MAWPMMSHLCDGFVLMECSQFKEIKNNLRGYSVNDRAPDSGDDSWLRQTNLLRNMSVLEIKVFERSISTLLNQESGVLVVDDELISSRASDVELKLLSDRKSGKEGPVVDCVSCSLTNVLYGLRL